MAASFVTNYGHPENNGLSFASPKRTINQGIIVGTPLHIKGYFNESNTLVSGFNSIDNATINLRPSYSWSGINNPNQDGVLNIIPNTSGEWGGTNSRSITNIFCVGGNNYGGSAGGGSARCLLANFRGTLGTSQCGFTTYNTIISDGTALLNIGATNSENNIFSNFVSGITCTYVSASLARNLTYTLFSKSKFKFTMTGGSSNETTFAYPIGATDLLKLDDLKTRMATVYGGSPDDYLVGCKYTDAPDTDFFIDPSRNNYYLVPNSLPTKMSYDGKYIGARPEGSFLAFNSSNFTYSNFDANGNIVDQRVDATATSSIVDLLQIRTINKLDSLGQLAARNGNELNLTETILPNPLVYSDALTLNRTYKVYNGSITVGSTVYNIGDCFIAKGTSFFSGADTYNPTGITSGTLLIDLGCYEVENNSVTYMGVTYTTGQRFQCYCDSANTFTGTGTLKRFMGGFVRLLSEYYGNTGIVAGTTLRYMQTYEVVGGTSVSYNSVVYTPGQRFTALTTPTTFTAVGGSTLSEWNIGYPKSLEMKVSKTDATLSTDTWVKMHLTDTPLVNVDINSKITHGNLDAGFNRATAVALSCRYWQCRLTVQSLNIPY